ncbi:MAG: Spy/CpxP family protein refolding chaperone [Acidiferrobacterales bacterium]|nr:Spy/CpxP family protein refolding chaperone [Acidiferrobacterales bacterium]
MPRHITLAVVLVASLGTVTACSFSDERVAKIMVDHTARKLELSDQQKARLFDVATVALEFHADMKKDEKQLRQEWLTMYHSDKLDTDRINAVLTEKEEIFRRYSRRLVADIAEFHSTLTPEQKEKILELLEKNERRFGRGTDRGCRVAHSTESTSIRVE